MMATMRETACRSEERSSGRIAPFTRSATSAAASDHSMSVNNMKCPRKVKTGYTHRSNPCPDIRITISDHLRPPTCAPEAKWRVLERLGEEQLQLDGRGQQQLLCPGQRPFFRAAARAVVDVAADGPGAAQAHLGVRREAQRAGLRQPLEALQLDRDGGRPGLLIEWVCARVRVGSEAKRCMDGSIDG